MPTQSPKGFCDLEAKERATSLWGSQLQLLSFAEVMEKEQREAMWILISFRPLSVAS